MGSADVGCVRVGADEGADALRATKRDEAADAGALSRLAGTNGSRGFIRWMARARSAGADVGALATGWPPVAAAGSSRVVTAASALDGGRAQRLLDDESELFSSFGSWKASSTANSTSSPTRRSFLRRSALRAATRRPAMCVSRVLISSSSAAAAAELEVVESGAVLGVAEVAAAADPLYVKTFRWIVAASCGSFLSPAARLTESTLNSRPAACTCGPATPACVRRCRRNRWTPKYRPVTTTSIGTAL